MASAMTAPSSHSEDVSPGNDLENLKKSLSDGAITEEEYFFILLSLIGEQAVKFSFINLVESFRSTSPTIHQNLMTAYVTYFYGHSEDIVSNSVYSLDEQMQLDLALKLSVTESESQSNLKDMQNTESPQSYENYASGFTKEAPVISSRQKRLRKAKHHSRTSTWSSMSDGAHGLHGSSQFSFIPSNNGNTRGEDIFHKPAQSVGKSGTNSVQLFTSSKVSEKKAPDRHHSSCTSDSKMKRNKEKNKIDRPLVSKPVILWFRRDLRIYDNPALIEACKLNSPVIPVFIWSEHEEGPLAAGGATKVWLHHALKSLNQSLVDRYGSRLVYVQTKSCKQALITLTQTTNASTVIWNDLYEPHLQKRDDIISESLKGKAILVKRFHSYCLHNPYSIKTDSVGMRGIGSVSHFVACAKMSSDAAIPLPEDPPITVPCPDKWPESQTLEELELDKMPRRKDGSIIDWASVIRTTWDFTEDAAYTALEDFLSDRVKRYEKESARSDTPNTSGLSPYLHFGQISPQTVYHESKLCKSPKFIRKLAWRDLSYWLLTLFPEMPTLPMRPHYRHQRWSQNKRNLKAWQKGTTGYPLVDAAMRELWTTGWMNNYMRHVVASFLIAYLHLHWIEGYNWFQDTLLDADVAINAMMWQNGGMSGLDHWNFVMHPVDAAMTCDPKGEYVRRWIPELAQLPDEHIHKPWKCPPSILKRCGVQLGKNYPERIITDLEEAREQSLQDVVEARLLHGKGWIDEHGNDMVPLPSGRKIPVITRKEFKYKTSHPEAKDNPHSAVLRGYRSRQRDEAVAFANKVDFLCSTMDECVKRKERYDRFSKLDAL